MKWQFIYLFFMLACGGNIVVVEKQDAENQFIYDSNVQMKDSGTDIMIIQLDVKSCGWECNNNGWLNTCSGRLSKCMPPDAERYPNISIPNNCQFKDYCDVWE